MAHEIMKNDGLFLVKQAAWHGLGTVLPEAPSIGEAIQAAKLDWQVTTEPLFTSMGEKVDAQATRRADTKDILGVVGPNYTAVQNADALNIFQPLVEAKLVALETAGSLKNGRRVWILAKILGVDTAEVAKNDALIPYVLLSNSHDGKTAVRLGFTPIRVVCANTLAAAQNSGASKLIRVTHTAKVLENIQALRDTMNFVKADFEATLDSYRFLASRDINSADLEKYVRKVFNLPAAEDEGRYPKSLMRSKALFEQETARNWWTAYNAVQGFMQHEQGRTADARLDGLWFGPNQAKNIDALKTALDMAGVV